jgi:hypothetical protein
MDFPALFAETALIIARATVWAETGLYFFKMLPDQFPADKSCCPDYIHYPAHGLFVSAKIRIFGQFPVAIYLFGLLFRNFHHFNCITIHCSNT